MKRASIAVVALLMFGVAPATRAAATPDTTPPTLWVSPYAGFAVGRSIGPSAPATAESTNEVYTWSIDQRPRWRGRDASGICGYDVRVVWAESRPTLLLADTMKRSMLIDYATDDNTYDDGPMSLRVTAYDCAGNSTTKFASIPTLVSQEDGSFNRTGQPPEAVFTYHGAWATSNNIHFSGGHTRKTLAKGASVKIDVVTDAKGEHVALVMEKGPNRGKAAVYVDGTYRKTINTYANKTKHRVIVFDTWLTAGPHTIKVVNKATPGHRRIDLDAVLTHDRYTAPPPTGWWISTTVDTANDVGYQSSITVGVDGRAIISHGDGWNADLRVTHCDNLECTSATSTSVDTVNDVGGGSSIAIGVDGLPVISHSYWDGTNAALRVTHCDNVACTSATSTNVDTVGGASSIAIGMDGLAIISHDDYTNGAVRVTHCDNVACTSATSTNVDVGWASSIAIGADGLAIISHGDGIDDALRVTHCDNVLCTSATSTNVDTTNWVGVDSSIAIGADGLAIISHTDDTNDVVRVTHCDNVACTSATSTNVDTKFEGAEYSSIAIGVDGLAIISHRDSWNYGLRVTHCDNVTCTLSTSTSADSATDVGVDSSITIGSDGQPIIAHRDLTKYALRVTKYQPTA